jgi:excisionase family DNA binding protein
MNLTADQAATYLAVSRSLLLRWAREGRLR